MKTKTDRLLLILFLAASLLSSHAVLAWLELLPDFGIPIEVRAYAALISNGLPPFLLQLLLCRNVRRGWIKALPLVALGCVALACFLAFATAGGWDSLGWLILLILCIPPAVGIALAFLVHWIWKRLQK